MQDLDLEKNCSKRKLFLYALFWKNDCLVYCKPIIIFEKFAWFIQGVVNLTKTEQDQVLIMLQCFWSNKIIDTYLVITATIKFQSWRILFVPLCDSGEKKKLNVKQNCMESWNYETNPIKRHGSKIEPPKKFQPFSDPPSNNCFMM